MQIHLDTGIMIAIISLIAGCVGYYYRLRMDRKSSKKLLLYHLLEIRHRLMTFMLSPDDIYKQYISFVEDLFKARGLWDGKPVPENIKAHMIKAFGDQIKVVCKEDETIVSGFLNALIAVAKEDPLLAWELRGQELVREILEVQSKNLDDYSDSLKQEVGSDGLKKYLGSVHTSVKKELLTLIDTKVLKVAKSCSIITFIRTRRIIKEYSEPKFDFKGSNVELELNSLCDLLDKSKAKHNNHDSSVNT